MSVAAYLVAHQAKHVLGIGKLERDDAGRPVRFYQRNTDDRVLAAAIISFLAAHLGDDVRLIPDHEFWSLDLTGYERVDEDYGVRFRGDRMM